MGLPILLSQTCPLPTHTHTCRESIFNLKAGLTHASNHAHSASNTPLSQSVPTWVVFKDTDSVLVYVDLAGPLEECSCVHVRCRHGAVNTLNQLTHTRTDAPVTVQVHRIGLG